MEEKNIIKRFLDAGLQLDRSVLNYFKDNKKDIGIFIEKFNKLEKKPNTITTKVVQKLLRGQSLGVEINNLLIKRKDTSIGGLVNMMADRYNTLKDILEEKKELKNLLSINKISPNTKDFSIICMVRNIENETIAVEDMTGELTLNLKNAGDIVLQDDIVGLICEQRGGVVSTKKVIWPDISLKRDIKKLEKETSCIFIGSKVQKIDVDSDNIVVFATGPERKLKCTHTCGRFIFLNENPNSGETPVHTLPLIAGLNGVNIVVLSARIIRKYEKHWKEPIEVVKNLLKRRDIDPTQEIEQNYTTASVLTDPPDIIAFPNEGESVSNYKGTTIIPVPEDGGYHIDLSTREVKKI